MSTSTINPAITTAVVVIGGDLPNRSAVSSLPNNRTVIAADSGYANARHLGLQIDVLVGDMDSITDHDRDHAVITDTAIHISPTDKDETDTELALRWAILGGHQRIVLISGGGDRLDHHLGAIAVLANPELVDREVEAFISNAYVKVLHGPARSRLVTSPNQTVALLATGGSATGITTSGVKWPLTNETLHPWSSRGVSNVTTGTTIEIEVESGVLFVIFPNALALESAK